jgi:adenylate cyclase
VPSYAVKVGESSLEPAPKPAPATHFGRNPTPPPAAQLREVNTLGVPDNLPMPRLVGVLSVIGAALVAINLFSWHGVFWARWPLFAFAMIALLASIRRRQFGDRGIATLGVIGLGLVAINIISWSGEFWAKWPLLGLAIVAGIRWVTRRGDNPAR